MTKNTNIFTAISKLITGWRFGAFVIALCLFTGLMLASVLMIPPSQTGLGAFASEFKTWCFGYDPATGSYEWGYVAVMLVNPLILAGFVYLVWLEPLHRAFRRRRWSLVSTAGVALVVTGMLGAGLVFLGPEKVSAKQLPFPAEALRTQLDPPHFELTDHTGQKLAIDELKGRVVLVTAIYTSCHTACPAIIMQAKQAIAELSAEQQEQLTVVAITLDPENDTPKRLAMAAKAHQIDVPMWHLMAGDPAEVNRVLDELNVSRRRDPKTGMIQHSNLFALVDRSGKIAYRLTLGSRHANWLPTALKVLIREKSDVVSGS